VRETVESGVKMAIPYLTGGPDVINMGQGMVYWHPPAASLQVPPPLVTVTMKWL
jgi:hypothetical protein